MNNIEHITERSYGLRYIVKKLFLVCLGLVITLFFIQTAKLATVGRMGAEISQLETTGESMKLENEILRSKISELRSSEKVKSSLEKVEGLNIVEVSIIPSINPGGKTDVIASK